MTTKTSRHDAILQELTDLDACDEARDWFAAGKFKSKRAAWDACNNVEWLLWLLEALGKLDPKKARLFACWCVRETPLADGRKVWDLLTDERSRNAVEVAERFANAKATQEELAAAWAAARAAAWDAARAAARDAAWDAARAAAWDAAWAAAWDAARDAARAAARDAAWAAAWAAARAAARAAAWDAARAAARAAAWDAARDAHVKQFKKVFKCPFKD